MSEATTTGGAPGTRDWARWRPWLVAGLALWLLVGVVLVDRANRAGQVSDITFSPAHVVAYAALLVLAVYAIWAFLRALRRGRWREAFPRGYAGLGIAVVAAIGWIVLDGIWRSTLGLFGLEEALGPPRYLVPIAIAAVAWGPISEALRTRRATATLREVAPAVVAVAVLGATLTLVTWNPVREPRNDLTFGRQRDQAEIWTMNADGTDQTRILPALETGIDFSLPAWSPDGTRIAYTQWANEPGVALNVRTDQQTATIWTMAADGSDRTEIVKSANGEQAWIPAWSPDGQWIAYTVFGSGSGTGSGAGAAAGPAAGNAPGQLAGPSAAMQSRLWIAHPDGTGGHALTGSNGSASAPAWSADGSRIAFSSGLSGNSEIRIARFQDGALVDEHDIAADPANDWAAAWSPDGTRLAFSSDRAGGDDIWVVGADGTGLTRLTDERGTDWVPVWTPDGTRIVFVSDRNGDVEVWSMAPDGSDLRDLTNSPGTDDGRWSVSIASDGRIAFGRTAYPVAEAADFSRFDFAAAMTVLWALTLAIVALLLVGIGAPFGGFTLALVTLVAVAAIPTDEWQFLPAAAIAGVATDLLVRARPPAARARIAAAALPAFAVLGVEATLAVASTEAWSVTLVAGVAIAAALAGLGLAEIVRRLAPTAAAGS